MMTLADFIRYHGIARFWFVSTAAPAGVMVPGEGEEVEPGDLGYPTAWLSLLGDPEVKDDCWAWEWRPKSVSVAFDFQGNTLLMLTVFSDDSAT